VFNFCFFFLYLN